MHKHKKKIYFFGTPEIAIPSLEKIVQLPEYEIIGVGVFPDQKIGRKQVLTPCVVKQKAIELDLPIFEIANKTQLQDLIKKTDFDLAIVIAFGMIFPSEILKDQKFINVHFSLLPHYRGASPVQSAILHGEKESGITWQIMAPRLDAGNILFQKKYKITNKKTSELWHYFAQQTAQNFPEFLERYFKNQLIPTPQKEGEATFCGKFEKHDGKVNFQTMTATQIYQKFCAFDVWPEIFVKTKKGNIKLKEISLKYSPSAHSVECKNNTKIFLEKIQIPGKKPAPIKEVLKGHKDLF